MSVKTITLGEIKIRLKELESKYCDEDERDELFALRELQHDLSWCWDKDNTTLIRGADFTEFVQQTLYDIDDIRKGGVCDGLIDWDKAAEVVENDYKSVTYELEQYFVRN